MRSREDGAVAVMFALLALVLLASAALSVDIASQVMERQKLRDTVDAAAHAAAGALPTGENSKTADQIGRDYAAANDLQVTLASGESGVRFWCLVGAVSGQPDTTQLPAACNPGPEPYVARDSASFEGKIRCNDVVCKIPCRPSEGDLCNTAEVLHEKEVDFGFGGAIGTSEGSTGIISAAACKGPCGSPIPNPIDFAIVADRTSSMSSTAFSSVKQAMLSLLEYLTPSQHQVALGTNSRSRGSGACSSAPATNNADDGTNTWFPVGLYSDYDNTDVTPPSSSPELNNSSSLVKSIECMSQSSGLGTWLAAPIDAGTYLLTQQGRPNVKKVMFYLTDGEPNEKESSNRSRTSLTELGWGNTNPVSACSHARTAATDAKTDGGVLVFTIAYDLSTATCGNNGPYVTSVLAEMASDESPGVHSEADGGGTTTTGSGCASTTEIEAENADGDYFFCTASPSDLEPIFRTAAGQITGGTRLVSLPAD